MTTIDVSAYQRVVVLSGAGISVASGLRAYRGPGGVWTDGGDESLATVEGFARDPDATWGLFGPLRNAARDAVPNAAHLAIARMEERAGGEITVITQNVDGLHSRAGSSHVIEVHGNIARSRCSVSSCESEPFVDPDYEDRAPPCPSCGAPLRPDVVFFGEGLPVDEEWAIKTALREVDLFIAIGTSGTVSPASGYVRSAAYSGARTVYVNLEPMSSRNPYFRETYLGPAELVLPELLGVTR